MAQWAAPEFTPFGSIFAPLYYRKDGTPVWPILGGADDDAGTQSGSDTGGGSGDAGSGGTETSDDADSVVDGDDTTGKTGDDAQRASTGTVSQAEYDALKRRMQAADRRAADNEKALQAIKDKEKTDLERAQDEKKRLEEQLAQQKAEAEKVRLENAFTRVKIDGKTITWHDVDIALDKLDRDLITVDDDGKVKGMEAAVKKLVKEKPFLVAEEKAQQQPSGAGFNGDKKTGKVADRDAMASKYPAMRGRGGHPGGGQ